MPVRGGVFWVAEFSIHPGISVMSSNIAVNPVKKFMMDLFLSIRLQYSATDG